MSKDEAAITKGNDKLMTDDEFDREFHGHATLLDASLGEFIDFHKTNGRFNPEVHIVVANVLKDRLEKRIASRSLPHPGFLSQIDATTDLQITPRDDEIMIQRRRSMRTVESVLHAIFPGAYVFMFFIDKETYQPIAPSLSIAESAQTLAAIKEWVARQEAAAYAAPLPKEERSS